MISFDEYYFIGLIGLLVKMHPTSQEDEKKSTLLIKGLIEYKL